MQPKFSTNWPPKLTAAQLEALSLTATTYALSHGLLYLPANESPSPAPVSAIHAPVSLFPSLFPRRLFEHSQRLQRIYNVLYARIAMDVEFLDAVMGAEDGVGKVDDFVRQLWIGWKEIRDVGGPTQPLQLGLFRSDYILHECEGMPLSLKQVEFNTISSSFGPLSERASGIHRYLHASGGYPNSAYLQDNNFPQNNTTAGLAEGLAKAHKTYNVEGSYILFVTQGGERNVFDQKWLEYELLEKHSMHVVRQTFDDLASSGRLDPNTLVLYVTLPSIPSPVEISTIYFRAGYSPTDFPTHGHYLTRFLLECCRAIKCPSIPLQLAGGKKIQQVLTNPGVLERFLRNKARWGDETKEEDLKELRDSWMVMWGLDNPAVSMPSLGAESVLTGVQKARELAGTLVLKPQREGGGNNVYKDAIPAFLDSLPPNERQAWIAMELIQPPEGTENYLVRAGAGTDGVVKTEVVSELGIFGWALFGFSDQAVREKEVGWLVRTKGKDSNEGGVATGFSVLDSLLLVEDRL